jgi:sirohydrochlorin cobaltochelatase
VTPAALVLAAHGSDVEPSVNEQVRACAAAAGARGRFAEVAAAFHRGDPPFSRVLDQLVAHEAVVVPLMTSVGYYSDVVLPRALAKCATYATKRVQVTRPVGTHPRLRSLVAERVRRLMRRHGLAGNETTLALIGHGTPRHGRSRDATLDLANRLGADGLCAAVRVAFLDDDPPVETLLDELETPNVVVEPFLMSDGPHTTQDIPRRMGNAMQNAECRVQNAGANADSRKVSAGAGRVVIDSAVGTDPGMADLVIDLADRALRHTVEAPW